MNSGTSVSLVDFTAKMAVPQNISCYKFFCGEIGGRLWSAATRRRCEQPRLGAAAKAGTSPRTPYHVGLADLASSQKDLQVEIFSGILNTTLLVTLGADFGSPWF
jgi:hypothetical protein